MSDDDFYWGLRYGRKMYTEGYWTGMIIGCIVGAWFGFMIGIALMLWAAK